MNWLRLCFVLMLVVLLPVRGAVAAAMLCPPAVPAQAAAGQDASHPHAAHAHHHDRGDLHASLQTSHDHHGEASHHGASHSVQDGKCNLCAASCSLTTLAGHPPLLPEPPVASAAAFPVLSAPAPSFLSSGQERPPRSI